MEEFIKSNIPNWQDEKVKTITEFIQNLGVCELEDLKYVGLGALQNCDLNDFERNKLMDVIRRHYPRNENEEKTNNDIYLKKLEREIVKEQCKLQREKNLGHEKEARNKIINIAVQKYNDERKYINWAIEESSKNMQSIQDQMNNQIRIIKECKASTNEAAADIKKMLMQDPNFKFVDNFNLLDLLKKKIEEKDGQLTFFQKVKKYFGWKTDHAMNRETCINKFCNFEKLYDDLKLYEENLEKLEASQKSLEKKLNGERDKLSVQVINVTGIQTTLRELKIDDDAERGIQEEIRITDGFYDIFE